MRKLFEIFKLNDKDARKIQGEINKPHIHTYEELIIGMHGKIEHFIDFKSNIYDAPFACYVSKGKTHKIVPQSKNERCEFWVLRFKSEFIPESAFKLYSKFHDSANLLFKQDRTFKQLVSICEMIHDEMIQEIPKLIIVKKLLSTLFTMIDLEQRSQQQTEAQKISNQNTTFLAFLNILEANFHRSVGVNYYAEKLFMSSKNLNTITQKIWQQSVTEIIESRKLLEAKNLLLTTDKTIAEIGYELGFAQKAYFTSVFKKKSGFTPSTFRKQMKSLTD